MLALQRDAGHAEAPKQSGQTRHAYSSVLHELIYALMGLTGDVFVDARSNQASGKVSPPSKSLFHVSDEASWLSPADKSEINGILSLGFHYSEIDRFVHDNQDPLSAQSKPGAWQALACGLEGVQGDFNYVALHAYSCAPLAMHAGCTWTVEMLSNALCAWSFKVSPCVDQHTAS